MQGGLQRVIGARILERDRALGREDLQGAQILARVRQVAAAPSQHEQRGESLAKDDRHRDIAGYTRLAGRLDAATVDRLVERYFGAFLDEILKHDGDVNETAGDGLMVIFQDDADPRRHARAAVATSLSLLRRAREINAAEPLDEPIALHIGVNSGRAAVGATKIEGTAGTRWTYTASGPVTNVAARLAALGDDAIYVGDETAARLPSRVGLEDLGDVPLRNVAEPVRVYRLRVPERVAAIV